MTAPRPLLHGRTTHTGPTLDHVAQDDLVAVRRDGAITVFGVPEPGAARLLDLLVDTTCESLGVDYAGVHLLRQGTHEVAAAAPAADALPETSLPSDSLCSAVMARAPQTEHAPQVVEVADTLADPELAGLFAARWGDVPAAAPVRFYAAAPLRDADGTVVATLCAVAHHARELTTDERRILLVLGLAAARVLGLPG